MKQPVNLIVDLNNLAFVTRYAKLSTPRSRRQKDARAMELIFVEMLKCIISTSVKFRATGVVITCDSKSVWRRDIYPDYKAGSTSDEDIYYRETLAAADLLKQFIKDHTAAFVLSVDRCEADDIIGFWCQESEGVVNIIFSTDTDYVQLIDENTRVYSVKQGERTHEDPAFALFLKCIRGDKSDTIESAFPRVYETRVRRAWEDPVEMMNLMEETRKDGRKVSDQFFLNQQLIDLSQQPSYIRDSIHREITNATHGEFNILRVMKAMGDLDLKSSARIFDGKDRAFVNPPVFRV